MGFNVIKMALLKGQNFIAVLILITVILFSNLTGDAKVNFRLPKLGKNKDAVQESIESDIKNSTKNSSKKSNETESVRSLKKLVKKQPNSPDAPEALFKAGQIYFEKKQWKKAYKAYNEIITKYPHFNKFNSVIQRQNDIALEAMSGDPKKFLFFFNYHDYALAIEIFENIIKSAPYHELAPKSLINIAEANKKRKKTIETIDALDRLIDFYPEHELVEEAYLKLAETFSSIVDGPDYDQDSTSEAMNYFQDFLYLYPESKKVAVSEQGLANMKEVFSKSKLVIGDYYFYKRNNTKAARVFYNEAITVAPNSPSSHIARTQLKVIDEIIYAHQNEVIEEVKATNKKRGIRIELPWKK